MSDQPAKRQYAFTVALTVYSTLKQSKGKSTTKWQEKPVKTKEMLFPLNENNYVEFLESVLEKHSQTKYRVSCKQRFSFKFTMPKTKSQCMSEAMDVDNESDYKEMVQKIYNTASDPSAATKFSVDMKHVEKLPSHHANDHSGDEGSSMCRNTNICT
ncbi:hypothetical protein PAXRUDRAFT_178013 [Paxillus rubicundulus Ve08.2h10]|uniref:Uncharacterized protein n=1 Tax=Paxillus rubicundulus Ve08.2h10 TaxID=930991 RepID=A0A0D0D8X2_9AGAM|nr:hypothetical protein PAXRUDRAFT_178013 [Paxillus rubicundulus Ve08.2h10]